MENCKEKQRSLIMCVTPLQMLIAEKIIKSNAQVIFDLIVISLQDNEKYMHYYNRIVKLCDNSLYVVRGKREITSLFKLIRGMRKSDLYVKYENLYLASIDSRLLQYIISRNPQANIYTFDDGIANIVSKGRYHLSVDPQSKFKKNIWKMLGVKVFLEEVRRKSILHYTIYENVPNIIKNTKYIPLIDKNNSGTSSSNKTIKIFLGQPIREINSKYSNEYILKIIECIGIDYYYPHPREKDAPQGNYKIIDSQEIFEDYIANFLTQNPQINLEILSFISSALLNVAALKRVNVYYIYDENLFNLHQDFYNIAESYFGIQCKCIY